MVLPGSSCLYGILLFDGPTVVIINLFVKSGRCCLSRSLALFHELDHDDRSAHLAENHHDKQHDKATQLLVDQVEGKHAVDESTREEDQAEEDGDGEDADVEAFHLGGDGWLEVDRVRDCGFELAAVLEDRDAENKEGNAGEGADPLVKSIRITLANLIVI